MLEWASVAGAEYMVEYSDGQDVLKTWKTAGPKVTAFANKTQWIDTGLPKTNSHPSTVGSRFYRIIYLTGNDGD